MAKKTFIERALEQILADKDISRSHHLQLKKACESALGKYVTDNIKLIMWQIQMFRHDFILSIDVMCVNLLNYALRLMCVIN